MVLNKKRGISAICSIQKRHLHSQRTIRNHPEWRSLAGNDLIPGWKIIRREKRATSKHRKEIMCVIVRHNLMPGHDFYCAESYAKVDVEGPPDQFFTNLITQQNALPSNNIESNNAQSTAEVNPIAKEDVGLDRTLLHTETSDQIAFLCAEGFAVDDDNDPVEENIPGPEDSQGQNQNAKSCEGLNPGQEWGPHSFDPRVASNTFNVKPSIRGLTANSTLDREAISFIFMYEKFVGREMLEMICNATNKKMRAQEPAGTKVLTYGEFLRWIGLWLLMSTNKLGGVTRRDFWQTTPPSIKTGAPFRLNEFMSRYRFEQILKNIKYTEKNCPGYEDKFFEVREMIELWNKNVQSVFRSGFANCLNKSMSIWHNRYTCPGWMFVPQKPHPFGNEYHTICCALSGIMFGIDLVEGKDRPSELPSLDSSKKGNTVSLLQRMCLPIANSGKIVILDSGFCVLSGLILLATMGLYAAAQIKKRRYWPKHVPGEAIKERMKNEPNGKIAAISGKMDNVPYSIFALQEPSYTSMMMSTYGSIGETDYEAKRFIEGTKEEIHFRLNDVFANHFKYRHAVDDHNHLRHQIPSIEDTWATHFWPNRQFAFLLAISEVNAYKAFEYFVWKNKNFDKFSKNTIFKLHTFRKTLAFELINNNHLLSDNTYSPNDSMYHDNSGRRSKRGRVSYAIEDHQFETAPLFAHNFFNGKWVKSSPSKYPKHRCITPGCNNRVRTYCSCSPGTWRCAHCYGLHCFEVGTQFSRRVEN